jgi:5-methylcytosine-specific restriction endonuclease McrA
MSAMWIYNTMIIACPNCNHKFDATPIERREITKWAIEEDKKFFAKMTPKELKSYKKAEREAGM